MSGGQENQAGRKTIHNEPTQNVCRADTKLVLHVGWAKKLFQHVGRAKSKENT